VADAPHRVVLATRNAHKVAELNRILADARFDGELVGLDEFPGAPDVAETGRTFADNALLKARAIAAYTGLPAVADDSGLTVDALNGMPGILSARWAGKHGDDRANLELVLGQLADAESRGGAFVCVAALVVPGQVERPMAETAIVSGAQPCVSPGGTTHRTPRGPRTAGEWTTTGVLPGGITREPRGSNGFGYDPIFVPAGLAQTTAELTPEEKDAISHRGRAFRAIAVLIAAHAA
jgi:XTP/dITP diphosphohydrolase